MQNTIIYSCMRENKHIASFCIVLNKAFWHNFELDQCHFIMKYVHENANKSVYWDERCAFKYSGIVQICRSEVWEHRRKHRYEENSDALNHVCVFGSQYFDGFNVGKRHLSISCPWVSLFMLTRWLNILIVTSDR